MNSVTLTATVTQVSLGENVSIEGLLLSDGTFAVTVQQAAQLFQVRPDNAQRDFKRLLGENSRFVQIKVKNAQARKQEKALTILDFEKLIRKLDKKGNGQAEILVDALLGLSLTQLFSDAFNLEFDKRDRQAYLTARLEGKVTRRTWTDAIKDYLLRNQLDEEYTKWIWVNVSNELNVALFGKTAKQLRVERKIATDIPLRDTYTDKELKQIDRIESHAMILTDKFNTDPLNAIQEAIEFFKDSRY